MTRLQLDIEDTKCCRSRENGSGVFWYQMGEAEALRDLGRHRPMTGARRSAAVVLSTALLVVWLEAGAVSAGYALVERDARFHGQSIMTELSAANAEGQCRLDLEVAGGSFEPDYCAFEIISGGPECVDAEQCKPGYAINLRNARASAEDIASLVLFDLAALEPGTYRFDPNLGASEFKGQLIDKGSVARHLLRGAITLERRGEDKVHVALDVQFANGISVRGSGVLALRRVDAP